MAKYPNDDLFESTKMSFGEHLEELRVSLFRAVVGLVIGFAIGLLISKHVMNWMQYPLKQALENYYIEKAIDDLKTQYQDDVTPELQAFVRDNRLVFDEMYLEAAEVQRIGRKISLTEGPPKPSESAETLTPTKDAAEKPPIGQQSVPEQSAPEPPVGESKKADKSEAGPSGERPSSEGQADSSVSPAQEAAPAEKPTTVAETSQDVPAVDQKVESPGDAKKTCRGPDPGTADTTRSFPHTRRSLDPSRRHSASSVFPGELPHLASREDGSAQLECARSVHDLDEGRFYHRGGGGKPLDILASLDVCRGGALPARKELRLHVSAVQHAAVRGGR
jgi:hypothetical protein